MGIIDYDTEEKRGAVGIYSPTEQDKVWFDAAARKERADFLQRAAEKLMGKYLLSLHENYVLQRREMKRTAALILSLAMNALLAATVAHLLGFL